jgi:hypothetical protein
MKKEGENWGLYSNFDTTAVLELIIARHKQVWLYKY